MHQKLTRETPTFTPRETLRGDQNLSAYGHTLTVQRNHQLVRINAPSFFKDPDFLKWLNHQHHGPATWHTRGEDPSEFSDVFTHYGGATWTDEGEFTPEGSDTHQGPDKPGIPDHIYALIAEAVADATGSMHTEALVWISNLEE